ncbi:TPA: hypothetical protein ACQYBJ_004559, partial [Vibrio parahaemolyticus]
FMEINMIKKDMMDILFNNKSREILFSLVDRNDPNSLATDNDDVFEPTISSIFQLFDELMCKNTPDLYQAEWLLLYKSLSSISGAQRLPNSIQRIRTALIMSLEDLGSDELYKVDNFELSKKLAGFSDLSLCAIYYQVQKALVATKRNQVYNFPEIEFKG